MTTATQPISHTVIDILERTRDGNDLDPYDLYLCQEAVNGRLNNDGSQIMNDILKNVKAGEYQKQWMYGIEGLARESDGYITWRGTVVEHFSYRNIEDERNSALELAETCRSLEERGLPVTSGTAVWRDCFRDAPAGTPWVNAMLKYYSGFKNPETGNLHIIFHTNRDSVVSISVNDQGTPEMEEIENQEFESGAYLMFHRLQGRGYTKPDDEINFGTYESFVQTMESANLTPEIVDDAIMNEIGLTTEIVNYAIIKEQ